MSRLKSPKSYNNIEHGFATLNTSNILYKEIE